MNLFGFSVTKNEDDLHIEIGLIWTAVLVFLTGFGLVSLIFG